MNKLLSFFCFLLALALLPSANAQNTLWSIVTNSKTEVVCKSMTLSIEKQSHTITVLNNKGMNAARFFCWCDQYTSLQNFSGEIRNSQGQVVRKIKKSDLEKSEYSSSLATDDYFYYYDCQYPTYPFTVTYTWELKRRDGIIGFPSFIPQTDFGQSVVKASYRIEIPQGQNCRYHELNTQGKNIKIKEIEDVGEKQIIEVTAVNLTPIPKEPFSQDISKLIPKVYFAPSVFQFEKTKGEMKTWQTYGKWQFLLLKNRDRLSEELKKKVHELTDTCTTDKEKVRALYNYLAANTRYVSIQLGIGGLQPIDAIEIGRNGFGDCKGLSNFLRALLKEINIPSIYTAISTKNEELLPKFPSANQMNHVILQVPLPQDTLWLECTNPQLPFGYVHQAIAGHDALLIKESGGYIHQLPSYPDSLNIQQINANIQLSDVGESTAKITKKSFLFQYEKDAGIIYMNPHEQKDIIRANINLPQANISDIQITENKDKNPSLSVNYTLQSSQYGTRTSNRLFVPVNIFRKGFNILNQEKRLTPIKIEYGYTDVDNILLQIPTKYKIESMPQPVTLHGKFGSFHSEIKVKDNNIQVKHHLQLHKGIYSPEEYSNFCNFLKQVSEQYDATIVLTKNNKP